MSAVENGYKPKLSIPHPHKSFLICHKLTICVYQYTILMAGNLNKLVKNILLSPTNSESKTAAHYGH